MYRFNSARFHPLRKGDAGGSWWVPEKMKRCMAHGMILKFPTKTVVFGENLFF